MADDRTRSSDRRAWSAFCDALENAGAVVAGTGSPADPLDQAEGYRYLTRLIGLGLEKFVEHNDPKAPRFYRLSHETAKIGADNPDSFYQNATVSGAYDYRIKGRRGTVAYLGFGTYYGSYGSSGRSGCSGYLESGDLEIEPDGTFEIVVSSRPHPGNWLPMEPDTSMLIVRQNVLDRDEEELAELRLERMGTNEPPPPLQASDLERNLNDAAAFVAGTARLFSTWAEGFAARPNQLVAMDPAVTGGAHGDPNIFFYMGYWELEPDRCLLVEADPPRCEYWNFQLNNHWMESLDYRYHAIHYNKHTASYRDDGSFRLIVAHRDPGLPNWVDTAGHARGTMALRWVKAEGHPQPRVRVVATSDLTPG